MSPESGDATRWDLEAAEPPGETPARSGDRFSGCVIEKKLGQGGMGIVYLARRESDGRKVVIKFLLREHSDDPMWRKRFEREGLLVRGLSHPNVVAVFAVELEGPTPYIVMELVEGEDLEERLARAGRLVPLEAARIGRDVARALASAHAHGIVHRDVKPGNIRIAADGTVKLLDFGLAKNVMTDEGISIAGQALGTPYYMAPEQWGEHDVDPRADVWSLGATLYHLVTGRVPFPGSRPSEILYRVCEARLARPRELVPEIPEDLDLAILEMLSRDRGLRQPTAERCALDLERVLTGAPVDVPCLVEVATGVRHPLLPGSSFSIGTEARCDVRLGDPGVAPVHAVLSLEHASYHLHDEGSAAGSLVEGMRVESSLLRTGDRLRFGSTEVVFRDGGLAEATGAVATTAPRGLAGSTLPEAFLRALAEEGDRRVVLALVEEASSEVVEARVASARIGIRSLLGGGVAELAGARLESRLRSEASDAASVLFRITHENLGGDLEAWLRWWDRARASYPAQLGPYRLRPAVRLRVSAGEPERSIELDAGDSWVLGRGTDCQIQLRNMSVSRRHATILRLDDRLVIRDDGSRFGVRINDRPVSLALLHPDDRIALATSELRVESEDAEARPPRTADGCHAVALEVVDALVDVRSHAVVTALQRFAVAVDRLAWVDPWARKLFPDDEARAARVAASVRSIYRARAEQARVLLPVLMPALASLPVEEWASALEGRRSALPPQLVPVAWFPERPGKRSAPLPRRLDA